VTKQKQDRDAAIEQLLRDQRGLVSPEREGGRMSTTACLDADTLAAWEDHALSAAERAAVEAHAADCARCQMMLAAMAKSAPAPTEAAPSWWTASRRWLIPLTATAATAAIAWLLVSPGSLGPVNVRQVSQAAESSAPEQPPPPAARPSSAQPELATPAPSVADRERAVQPPAEAKDADLSRRSAKKAEADNTADLKTELQRDQNVATDLSRPSAGGTQADLSRRSAEGAKAEGEKADAAARREARLEKAPAAAEQSATPPAAPVAAPAAAAPAVPTAAAARTFAFGAPDAVIVSSNPASRWRILQGGSVQHSTDGGATWQMQTTGVTETLASGSSPSPSVCWLVGPRGIVLLSTDGVTWKRVAFPEAVLLVKISATDRDTATVTAADGRQFVTDDAGRTWTHGR